MRIKLSDYSKPDFIKIIREWTELTQEEFGKEIGKSGQTISDYESGKTKYNIDTLKNISEKFKIEIIAEKK